MVKGLIAGRTVNSDLAFKLSSAVLAHELAMRRVAQSVQLEFVGTRKSLSAVGTRVRLRVECPRVPSRCTVHIKRLVAPRTCVHAGDWVGVADGVRSENVDLVEALVAESTHVVLAAGVHLAVTRQRRVVDKSTITHLQRLTAHTIHSAEVYEYHQLSG